MITKNMWIKILEDIKWLKDGIANPKYCRIEIDRRETTVVLIITILMTPITILSDFVTIPFQLMYLITYKLLWKKK